MSFADEVRNELARIIPERRCCQRSELTALIRSNGTLSITQRQIGLILKTDNAAVARKIFKLIKANYNLFTEIMVRKKMRFHRHNSYQVKIPPQKGTREMLIEAGVLDSMYRFNYKLDHDLVARECCSRSYLRGTFLGAGSVNHPDRGYHLEFSFDHEEYARELLDFFNSFQLNGNMTFRKNSHVIYFKNSDDIATFLNLIGAHSALLKYEDYRVMKNIKNDVNRRVNCETANLEKTITASMQQLEDIQLIADKYGIDSLPASLQEIARLRIAHPYVSLKELGQLLNPPLSKSGVNGRLRRITKIANKIRQNQKIKGG
ncbi:DNA-binding protein WhiA [Anoxybacter fermentans]|uniref:Probable cell division protein WhiA n=1 Tax=Anoxybacter fermentans TaxID=1323375 RepID=A0A3S9T2K6_9FIRM|nr:DNA-binding protein WhiA [Anoxybacter fermentans]